jgi:hypothetical protein
MRAPLIALLPLCLLPQALSAQMTPAPTIVSATGILSHDHDALWQVRLQSDHEITVNGRKVGTLHFIPDWLAFTPWFQEYEGKIIEISGEVDLDKSDLPNAAATITLQSITQVDPGWMAVAANRWCGASLCEVDPNDHAPGEPLYRFGYYLVLLDTPVACERCYVPLLMSPEPFDSISTRKGSVNVVSIVTYERDSIWQMKGRALITADAIDRSSHTLHFRGRNYRYELAPANDLVHFLEHPPGTLPVSRPFMSQIEVPGGRLGDLVADLHTLFRVRERRNGFLALAFSGNKRNSPSAPVSPGSTTEFRVFDDGKVEYRSAPGCVNRTDPAKLNNSYTVAESWNWRETCPGSQKTEKQYDYVLNATEFARLKELLNRSEVRKLYGCFCNAGTGVGDYDIEIARSDSTQSLQAVSFMPQHLELREHPALTYLICQAKAISQHATNEDLPSWCSNLATLK